jgi:hypothetical protein
VRHPSRHRRRLVRLLAGPAVLTAALAPAGPAGAATTAPAAVPPPCVSMTGTQPPGPGSAVNFLTGVAVVSPCSAWAVGASASDGAADFEPLTEHYDGQAWSQVPAPGPGRLAAVTALPDGTAWAVGSDTTASGDQVLIEQWDGQRWTAASIPPTPGRLAAVGATSGHNVWAVGTVSDGSADQTLTMHFDGTSWTTVPSPSIGSQSMLTGVIGIGWAVGFYQPDSAPARPLFEHWDGRKWSVVMPADPATSGSLQGIAATSPTDIWAVGSGAGNALIEHYDGTAWTRSASTGFPASARLSGVTATSATDAWAAGSVFQPDRSVFQPLIAHFDGTGWTVVPSPSPDTDGGELAAIGAAARGNVWTVGDTGFFRQALALHLRCC